MSLDSPNAKICWITDFPVEIRSGGAELLDDFLIKKAIGREPAYEIRMCYSTRSTDASKQMQDKCDPIPKDCDLYIVSNIRLRWLKEPKSFLVLNGKTYIKQENDFPSYLLPDFRKSLYEGAFSVCYRSPLQRDEIDKKLRIETRNASIITSTFDTSRFYVGKKKIGTCLYASYFSPDKGTDRFINFLRNYLGITFYVCGYSDNPNYEAAFKDQKNVKFLGRVPYEDMPKLFAEAEYFYHRPTIVEGGSRTVLEAMLSGCKLWINKNVSTTSFMWDFSDREFVKGQLDSAPDRFWELVGIALQSKKDAGKKP